MSRKKTRLTNTQARNKFADWIKRRGGPDKICTELGVCGHVVRYWLRQTRTPKIGTMVEIHRLSHGALTYEEIIRATYPGDI